MFLLSELDLIFISLTCEKLYFFRKKESNQYNKYRFKWIGEEFKWNSVFFVSVKIVNKIYFKIGCNKIHFKLLIVIGDKIVRYFVYIKEVWIFCSVICLNIFFIFFMSEWYIMAIFRFKINCFITTFTLVFHIYLWSYWESFV